MIYRILNERQLWDSLRQEIESLCHEEEHDSRRRNAAELRPACAPLRPRHHGGLRRR